MLKGLRERHKERLGQEGETESSSKPLSLQNFVSLETLKKLKIAYIPYNELLKEGFYAGLGWAFGVTIGFVIISTLIVSILNALGGLPLIGSWIAAVVETTQQQLLKRTPFTPH